MGILWHCGEESGEPPGILLTGTRGTLLQFSSHRPRTSARHVGSPIFGLRGDRPSRSLLEAGDHEDERIEVVIVEPLGGVWELHPDSSTSARCRPGAQSAAELQRAGCALKPACVCNMWTTRPVPGKLASGCSRWRGATASLDQTVRLWYLPRFDRFTGGGDMQKPAAEPAGRSTRRHGINTPLASAIRTAAQAVDPSGRSSGLMTCPATAAIPGTQVPPMSNSFANWRHQQYHESKSAQRSRTTRNVP
jgi:hypothetical protein